MRLDSDVLMRLRCPREHRAPLTAGGDQLVCSECGHHFPIIDGRPVLINEARSIFRIEDFQARRVTTMDLDGRSEEQKSIASQLRWLARALVPSTSYSASDFPPSDALARIRAEVQSPRVLVIGAGDAELDAGPGLSVTYSDVALGNLTSLIADAHDIPIEDATFDAVIAVAVLEHVASPERCVAEITRVLVPDGFVYSVTPFIQQVHMGRYDFTRFTHVGHRRLFRRFEELRSGVANGPAMAFAWSFEHLLGSLSGNQKIRAQLRNLARILVFPIKYLDRWLARRPAAYDCASSYYFFGRKLEQAVSDREIIETYRGPG